MLVFCANEKLHVVATGGERGEADQQGGREDMSAKEAQRGINTFLLRPSAALMQKVEKWKQTEQVGANLRSLSFTLLLGSPASGDQSGWRTRPKTKQNKAKKKEFPVVRREGLQRGSVWDQIVKGKGDDTVVKVCKNTRPSTAGT